MYTSLSVYKFWVLKRSGCSLFHKGGVSCRWSFCGGGLMLSSFERGLYCESGLLWLVVSCEGACSLVQVVFCGSLSQVCSTMKVYRPVSGLLWSVMRVVFPDGLMSTVLLYHTWSFLIVWCLRFSCIIHAFTTPLQTNHGHFLKHFLIPDSSWWNQQWHLWSGCCQCQGQSARHVQTNYSNADEATTVFESNTVQD